MVGLISSAVPFCEVICVVPTSVMLTVPELCPRKPNALVPLTVMLTPPLELVGAGIARGACAGAEVDTVRHGGGADIVDDGD